MREMCDVCLHKMSWLRGVVCVGKKETQTQNDKGQTPQNDEDDG
jgi:hypothetical protein